MRQSRLSTYSTAISTRQPATLHANAKFKSPTQSAGARTGGRIGALARARPTSGDARPRAEYSKSRVRWPWRPLQNHPPRRDSPARAVAGARFAPARAGLPTAGTERAHVSLPHPPCGAAWARRAGAGAHTRRRLLAPPRMQRPPKLEPHAQSDPAALGESAADRMDKPGSQVGPPAIRPPCL